MAVIAYPAQTVQPVPLAIVLTMNRSMGHNSAKKIVSQAQLRQMNTTMEYIRTHAQYVILHARLVLNTGLILPQNVYHAKPNIITMHS